MVRTAGRSGMEGVSLRVFAFMAHCARVGRASLENHAGWRRPTPRGYPGPPYDAAGWHREGPGTLWVCPPPVVSTSMDALRAGGGPFEGRPTMTDNHMECSPGAPEGGR